MHRNTRFVVLALALLMAAAPGPGNCAAADPPNVVLILADALGYSDIQPYGATDIRTPNLSRLANEGVRFTDAYATAPVCSPSRAALLTGRYQHRFGLEAQVQGRGGLPDSELTVASALQNRGYATAMIGKWHLGFGDEFGPNAHGFDESLAFYDWSIDYFSHRTPSGAPGLFANGQPVDVAGYSTSLFTDEAVSFIENQTDQPFFLYLAYNAALAPQQPPDRPDDVRADAAGAIGSDGWERASRADYVKVVESLDSGIGRILDALDQAGVGAETLVIFAVDHGGERPARHTPLSGGFATLREGGIRVACIMRWPARLVAGKVSSQQTILLDLMPTILAATGTSIPPRLHLDGRDLLPILNGDEPEIPRTFFWRSPPHKRPVRSAVRQGPWKLVEGQRSKLFDLDADLSEGNDVARFHPEVVARLLSLLREWESEVTPRGAH